MSVWDPKNERDLYATEIPRKNILVSEVKKGFLVQVQCKLGVRSINRTQLYEEKGLAALSEEWKILSKGIFLGNEVIV